MTLVRAWSFISVKVGIFIWRFLNCNGSNQNLRESSVNVNFTFHHFHETWTSWMMISPIFRDFEWITSRFLGDFTWKCWNYGNRAWTEFHNLELKWSVICRNAKNCFWDFFTVWKFHDFSITQILREIKFWNFRSTKSANSNKFRGSELWFLWFFALLGGWNLSNWQNWEPLKLQ